MVTLGPCARGWIRGVATAIALLALHVAPAGAVTIDEFPLGATPTGIASGPDDQLWVTTSEPGIVRVSPSGAVTERIPLTATGAPTPALPVFSGGDLWFVMRRVDVSNVTTTTIARRTPGGTVTEYPLADPSPTVGDLAPGPDGNVWFTEYGSRNRIGRITPAGLVTEFPADQEPRSLGVGQSGGLWVTSGAKYVSPWLAAVSDAGLLQSAPLSFPVSRVAGSPRTPTLWFAGTLWLCCYGVPSIDFVAWQTPGQPQVSVSNGFLGAGAHITDLTVGPDGSGWVTDDGLGWDASGPHIGRVTTSGRVTAFSTGLPDDAQPANITAGPGDTLWFTDAAGRVGRVRVDRPTTTTSEASGTTQSATSVGAVVSSSGVPARMRFEYGPTTAYGSVTPWQDVDDDDEPVGRSARLSGLTAATTYHYRAVVESPLGRDPGPDRTVRTLTPPPAPPPPPADTDGDGFSADVDCDDTDASVHPGAADVPGNGRDESCDGRDAPYPRFYPSIGFTSKSYRRDRYSEFTSLTVKGLPAHAGIELRCTGRGCDLTRWSTTLSRARARLDLRRRLGATRLRGGTTVELRLTLPGHVGTVVRWRLKPSPRLPKVTCLDPGRKQDRPC